MIESRYSITSWAKAGHRVLSLLDWENQRFLSTTRNHVNAAPIRLYDAKVGRDVAENSHVTTPRVDQGFQYASANFTKNTATAAGFMFAVFLRNAVVAFWRSLVDQGISQVWRI